MARPPGLKTVKSDFIANIISASNLFEAVVSFTKGKTYDAIQGSEPLHPAQARRVMALAFMIIVSAWEQFVESVFIRYMAGACSPSGYQPVLRVGPCAGLQHAGQLLRGNMAFSFESNFLLWSPWKVVTDRAKLFFDHGKPFSSLPDRDVPSLNHAFLLRNRVAHSSHKARADFVRVARLYTGKPMLRRGYDVGSLLLEKPSLHTHSSSYSQADHCFEAYLSLFIELAGTIAP
jgi:hypothetical protein